MRTPLVAALALALLALTACSSVPPTREILANIASANSAADHLRIADYFAQKAAGYEDEAKLHEKMPYAYQGRPRYDFAVMSSHCKELQNQLNGAAREARALERAHRDLAASIK
jgi:hypothetical protein